MTDVLIVGAGSAGSILAERLSADPACQVTLVEAGPGFDDPAMAALTDDATVLPIASGSPVARHYRSTLTDHPARSAQLVRGECLGGSGAINGCYFWGAAAADFGAVPGWSWADVVGHFDAVEQRIAPRPVEDFATGTACFVDAARLAGYGPDVVKVPLNIDRGHRRGPGAVFLHAALDRPNLRVLTGYTARRIRFAGHRAAGVVGVGPAGPVRIDADKVVLCAGAIGTAHLLMHSGIGPSGDLAECGIGVVADLPVGRRTWNHPEWVLPTGWTPQPGRPVLEVVLVTPELEVRPYTDGFGAPTTSIGVALMCPRGTGLVSLRSADPATAPRIQQRYDAEPADLAALRDGCELVRGIVDTGPPIWSTSQHLCGTAPMGIDEHAVLDPRCRVLGVDGLWVVDGSALPAPLGRGPHATVAMLAHRAAEFIR